MTQRFAANNREQKARTLYDGHNRKPHRTTMRDLNVRRRRRRERAWLKAVAS